MTAQRLLDLAWEWTARDVRSALALALPGGRDKRLENLGKPLAAVLTAAAVIGAAGTRDAISVSIRKQGDAVTTLEMSALRAASELASAGPLGGESGFGDLAADCAARLRARLDRPHRAHDDWSVELPAGGCACDLCGTLREFLADPGRRAFEWPLAQQRRQHVHARIDGAELPVTHETRRKGSPFTLVLTKTDALFTRELRSRASAATDLEWLAAAGVES